MTPYLWGVFNGVLVGSVVLTLSHRRFKKLVNDLVVVARTQNTIIQEQRNLLLESIANFTALLRSVNEYARRSR